MFNWRKSAAELLDKGEAICLVRITDTQGSTPRDMGTVMLVTDTQEYGTIGGGNLEVAAIRAARDCLKASGTQIQFLDYILGPDVEQCCGGRVELSLQKITRSNELPDLPTLHTIPVYIFGAGHVGQATATALAPLPFTLKVYDNRYAKVVGEVLSYSDVKHTISSAPKNTYFLIMTHDHNLDYELVSTILTRDDFAFLGLIGSITKKARFMSRLKKHGFSDAQLSRLTCPIGIERIQGKEPEIIAASIAAQLLQLRTTNGD
ncbi:MAG: xanthine dehydrogenase accessory protein XdhC [Robiginitomaculum sp.]|nr:xanthine dehydrogenase accessory protein XdhC [Robiginitomaculum sp.]